MLEFRTCALDEEPAAALAQGMRDEISALYDGLDLDSPQMPKAGREELGPPGGVFVVGLQDGVAVCCGGVKALPDGACEIKKMFVVASARGRGVARALARQISSSAPAASGTSSCGSTPVLASRAHSRCMNGPGYVAIENFNGNPVASFFGEKRL